MTVLAALNAALHQALKQDNRVVVLGEDILDPYGGAFKVTRGLSTTFPDRVYTTPIAESAIVGIAAGMALRGLHPVVEVMFGDFLGLAFDQLLNHACKYRHMYGNRVCVPMVIRTPMGGYRGYGPTHSQSIEKHFMGMPGLRTLSPNCYCDPQKLLLAAISESEDPTLFIEHKVLYTKRLHEPSDTPDLDVVNGGGRYPTTEVRIAGAPECSVTLTAYGYMAEFAVEAMKRLAMHHEVFAEVVIPSALAPIDIAPFVKAANRTRTLLTIEESGICCGWGSEVIASVAERVPLKSALRIGALGPCIPSSKPAEAALLPSVDRIVDTVLAAAGMKSCAS